MNKRIITTGIAVLCIASIALAEEPYVIEWSTQIGTSGDDRSYSVATDDWGGSYITGFTEGDLGGTNAGGIDVFLSRYDTSGNLVWSRQMGSNRGDMGLSVDVDGLGNIYVAGKTSGSLSGPNVGGDDAFLSKYNRAGDLLWSKQIGTDAADQGFEVAVTGAGEVYVTGHSSGDIAGSNLGLYDAFLIKFSTSGDELWSRQIGTSDDERGHGVAVDTNGNVYTTGSTTGDFARPLQGSQDTFITKFDGPGNTVWTQQIGGG